MGMTHRFTAIAFSCIMVSASGWQTAQAQIGLQADERCDIALNYDVRVEPQKLTLTEQGREKYRIELDKLYVEGKLVNLNVEQKKLVTQYANEVSSQVPEVIELIDEALSLTSQALSMALTPLLGDATDVQLDAMMAGIQKRVDTIAYKQGNQFYLAATNGSIQTTFNDEFEQQIERVVQNSIGSIMMNLGGELLSADGNSFEAKMEAFSQKMENLSQDIEQRLQAQSKGLEAKADRLCSRFEKLAVLETQMRHAVPELAPFSVIQNTRAKAIKI